MKINKIKFKITTSKKKLICNKCGKIINGEKGFIHIGCLGKSYVGENSIIKICLKCFDEFLKEFHNDRKHRKKKYKELFRKRILMGLK